MTARIGVRSGSVYLPADVAERYFPGVGAVVVMIRDGALRILPVQRMASGGCLLKVRNAAGDRVASAPDVFHTHGLADWSAEGLVARWSAAEAALVAELPEACIQSIQKE